MTPHIDFLGKNTMQILGRSSSAPSFPTVVGGFASEKHQPKAVQRSVLELQRNITAGMSEVEDVVLALAKNLPNQRYIAFSPQPQQETESDPVLWTGHKSKKYPNRVARTHFSSSSSDALLCLSRGEKRVTL
ncbi:MAG: hypothetical protein HC848_08205 [Limnobacter sp.]|nr:hypothetical protein [Limnobacter sp.]